MTRELAQTSPRPGRVRLRKASADFHRHAILRVAKFSAVICVSGEYFVPLRSFPYALHSPADVLCCARTEADLTMITAAAAINARHRNLSGNLMGPPQLRPLVTLPC